MKKRMGVLLAGFASMLLSGCSIFGYSNVETAPYSVLEKQGPYELRHYERLVLVTTSMPESSETQRTNFYKLFDYISGKNEKAQEIPMTSPVFMDRNDTKTESMSFVLPKDFTIKTAPPPKDPSVKLEEITDYTVAAITFSGLLSKSKIDENKTMLEKWIETKGYETTGPAKAAGYNPPFTIPAMRRNEILIPVKTGE